MAVLTLLFVAIASPISWKSITDEMDVSMKPGDDFYRYANGDWLKANTIPDGESNYDTRAMLLEKASRQVRDLVQEAASAQAAKGSVVQKVGDYYRSYLDQSSIDARGLSPLADE